MLFFNNWFSSGSDSSDGLCQHYCSLEDQPPNAFFFFLPVAVSVLTDYANSHKGNNSGARGTQAVTVLTDYANSHKGNPSGARCAPAENGFNIYSETFLPC